MAVKFSNTETDAITDINITPFVDVVLVLLVIFMVTAPMIAQQVVDIELPSSETADSAKTDTLGLAITAGGQFLLNGNITAEDSVFNITQAAVKKNRNVQVVIAADRESPHKHVIRAIDVIKKAGVENFAFQVNKSDDNKKD